VSPKQAIYCWLIHYGFVYLRGNEGAAASHRWWHFWWDRRRLHGYGWALANLLHRLDQTVLEPDFGEIDLSFLNHAVPQFLRQVGNDVEPSLTVMLVQLHDAVPDHQRTRLTWHPTEAQRRLVDERLASIPDAD
jgi:hypothetical protein